MGGAGPETGSEEGAAPTPLIYICETPLAAAPYQPELEARGYEVQLCSAALLIQAVQQQAPQAVICDPTTRGMSDALDGLRVLPNAEEIRIVLIAARDALAELTAPPTWPAAELFLRPIDAEALCNRLDEMLRPESPRRRVSTEQHLALALTDLSQKEDAGGLRPASESPPRAHTEMSAELTALLSQAEQRVAEAISREDATIAREDAEDDVDAITPESALEALDGPLGGGDDVEEGLEAMGDGGADPQDARDSFRGYAGPSMQVQPRVPADSRDADSDEFPQMVTGEYPNARDEAVDDARDEPTGIPERQLEERSAATAGSSRWIEREREDEESTHGGPRGDGDRDDARWSLQPTNPRGPRVTLPPPPRRSDAARAYPEPSRAPRKSTRPQAGSLDSAPPTPSFRRDAPTAQTSAQLAAAGGVNGANGNATSANAAAAARTNAGGSTAGSSFAGGSSTGGSFAGVPLSIPDLLRDGDAIRVLAEAIRSRFSGCLAFESQAGVRRITLQDGDFANAASGIQGESLIAFLAERGDLPAAEANLLDHRLPAFGRHAGAALIARGHLRQDQLWSSLREHAEWLLAKVMRIAQGKAQVEADIPERLAAEPAVFGGATGAEVFVDMVRRVVPPEVAMSRLGGESAIVSDSAPTPLLAECALGSEEAQAVGLALGLTLRQTNASAAVADFVSLLYALYNLGVINVVSPGASADEDDESAASDDELDDEARRRRIVARHALVEESDYFTLLGVPHSATGYDIRRAYLALRREFEPSRMLTARTADLADEVTLIVVVLEEAYEILRDRVRRERYRRAIEASPTLPEVRAERSARGLS